MNRCKSHYTTKRCLDCDIILENVYCNVKRCANCTDKVRFPGFRRYGVTPEKFKEMLEEQDNKCALCSEELVLGSNKTSIDHCHTTGRVRGILCLLCNVGLGSFQDNKIKLQKAIKYLERTCE